MSSLLPIRLLVFAHSLTLLQGWQLIRALFAVMNLTRLLIFVCGSLYSELIKNHISLLADYLKLLRLVFVFG